MATREEIDLISEYLSESNPLEFFKHMNQNQTGMEAILRYLYETDKMVTSGMISDAMGVSTARVAVLLRKMKEKGLITKNAHDLDARVTVVSLTERGKKIAKEKQEEGFRRLGAVIDYVGMPRMLEYVRVSREIREVMKRLDSD